MDDTSVRIELRRRNQSSLWALVDAEDADRVLPYRWNPNVRPNTIYAKAHIARVEGRRIRLYLHRFILQPEPGLDVDHINHDGLDNRRANLRVATRAQNTAYMRPKGGTSPYKGVYWEPGRGVYVAQIQEGKVRRRIGRFRDEIEAALAYDAAARRIFGEFALVNFPEQEAA